MKIPQNTDIPQVGDIAISIKGRDKGIEFLIIEVDERFVYYVDGKVRKIAHPKKKNKKHIEIVKRGALDSESQRISSGEPFSNKRLKKSITAEKRK